MYHTIMSESFGITFLNIQQYSLDTPRKYRKRPAVKSSQQHQLLFA